MASPWKLSDGGSEQMNPRPFRRTVPLRRQRPGRIGRILRVVSALVFILPPAWAQWGHERIPARDLSRNTQVSFTAGQIYQSETLIAHWRITPSVGARGTKDLATNLGISGGGTLTYLPAVETDENSRPPDLFLIQLTFALRPSLEAIPSVLLFVEPGIHTFSFASIGGERQENIYARVETEIGFGIGVGAELRAGFAKGLAVQFRREVVLSQPFRLHVTRFELHIPVFTL